MRQMIGKTKGAALFLTVLAVALVSLSLLSAVGWSASYPTTTVQPTEIVPVDIEPGHCPNPINVSEEGELLVAIVGTETLDVTLIDQASVRLEEVQPQRSYLRDVATPFRFYTWKMKGHRVKADYCTNEGPDGRVDLVIQFQKKDLRKLLGPMQDGEIRVVRLSARHKSGARLVGRDVVIMSK